MNNHTSGQILPFCMFLFCILLWIIFSNFEIAFMSHKKIQHQKKLDAYALELGNQYARGLNAIAALNEALVIAKNRGDLVMATHAALGLCAGIFNPVCSKMFASLSLKLPEFHRKLKKLGEELAKEQNRLATWIVRTRCQAQVRAPFDQFKLYPEFQCSGDQDVPFHRSRGPQRHGIPSPLVFRPEFQREKNKIIILAAKNIGSPVEHNMSSMSHSSSFIWSLTEIKIEGTDLNKMEFKPRLHAISMQSQLWKSLQSTNMGFGWPNVEKIKNETYH